jgi:hypothetical protein
LSRAPKEKHNQIKIFLAKKLKISAKQVGAATAYLAPGLQNRFKRKIPNTRQLQRLVKKYRVSKLL